MQRTTAASVARTKAGQVHEAQSAAGDRAFEVAAHFLADQDRSRPDHSSDDDVTPSSL